MSVAIQPGQVLAGKYRVERILGEGGMGVVIAALHLQLDRRVALKFLRPELTASREVVLRFSNEARNVGKIESEHVAKVLDVGVLEDGAPYMVMEYLEGSDLAVIVKKGGALAGHDAIEYVLQACEALAEAHVKGIVHRDLKPANLFLTHRADGSPTIKVLDFGISKAALVGGEEQALTQTSAVMGSPSYMAPEQLKSSRNVDARTDVWSLGIILHELLTGEVAFKADTVPELYVAILQDAPPPLRQRRRDAPAGLEAIVLRCLEKDPARRFANVGELAAALGEFAPPRAQTSIERIMKIAGVSPAARTRAPSSGTAAMSAMTAQGAPSAGQGGGPSGAGVSRTQAAPSQGQAYAQQPGAGGASGQSYAQQTGYAPGQGGQQTGHALGGQQAGYGPGQGGQQPGYGPGQGGQQAYGQGQGAPQAGYGRGQGGYGPGQGGQQAYPPGAMTGPQGFAQAQPRKGMHPSTIILIILVASVVLLGGSCTLCLCIGAAADDGGGRRGSSKDRPLPFQRRAGWTTVAAGEPRRPCPSPSIDPLRGVGTPTPAEDPRRQDEPALGVLAERSFRRGGPRPSRVFL
jgi:serine/threonine-protein kinase